jgi:hypothetical protein
MAPYQKRQIYSFADAIEQIIAYVTSEELHGEDAWQLIQHEPWPKGTILRAHGWQPGEKQYIGLMTTAMYMGSSYRNWFQGSVLGNKEVIATEFVYNKNGLNLPHGTPFVVDDLSVTVQSVSYEWQEHEVNDQFTYKVGVRKMDGNSSTTYTFSNPEIFAGNSQALFFGVFKQYDEDLNWHEQPGAPTPPVKPKAIKYYTSRSPNPTNWVPPAYPGVGFPAIGCDALGFIDGIATLWMVKDRHRLTIVIQNRDYWDVAQAGFLVPNHNPTEYAFPAVVVGSHSGAMPVIEPFTYPGASAPTLETGYKFDYSLTNTQLSHGNMMYAAAPWTGGTWNDNNCVSQVQAMLPDGTWKCFANWAVTKEILSERSGGTVPIYYFANKEPEQPSGMNYTIYPTYLDVTELQNVYDTTDEHLIKYQLEPVRLMQNENTANPRRAILGDLWRIYWPSRKVARYGEQVLDGKMHLVIPCGWEGRQFHYPHGFTRVVDPITLLATQRRIAKKSETMKCVIRLED